jgi:type II restriction enzyme
MLSRLGFDRERTNDRSALVFLALLHLRPGERWRDATNPMLGTRAIMDWIADKYKISYAPNTRETIRRQTLHQFNSALLTVENPDQPDRPVNSPKWCYQIHPRALELIREWDGPGSDSRIASYLAAAPGLTTRYAAERAMHRIPVTLPDGRDITLSPGGQNVLLQEMIENFCPSFTPGGHVLYVGDADSKWSIFEEQALATLGVVVDQHGKMPDLVVHLPERNWLVLLEAASSHGPVDAKRHSELSHLFAGSTVGLVYVSCFPSRVVMRQHLSEIAWETEVWCADSPTHLIHFNGERFLGPYDP